MSPLTDTCPSYPGLPAGSWLDIDGLSTWYTEAGSGIPMILIYGGNFRTPESAPGAYAWDMNFHELVKDFRVIIFDKPAQGDTPGPATTGTSRWSSSSIT